MANTSPVVIPGDLTCATLRATGLQLSGLITDAMIAALSNIAASKLEQQYKLTYSQNCNVDAAADRRVIHRARAAGTIQEINYGSKAICGAASSITFDVFKNGVSILTAVGVLDNTNTAYVTEAAVITTPTYVAGDVIEVGVTVAGASIGDGAFLNMITRELAQ